MLVLRTNFATTQIVDWIDQALLYPHAGFQGQWYSMVRSAGVRSASDLLDVSGVLRPDDQDRVNPASKPLDELITRIAGAAKHQAAEGGQVAPPDLTNTLYVMCDALCPDPNIRYVLAFMGYELRPEPPSDI